MRRRRLTLEPAGIAGIGAAEQRAVAVEELRVMPRLPHANAIVAARHRRKVEHHQHRILRIFGTTDERYDAVLVVGAVDPAEAGRREIAFVQGWLRTVVPVERLDEVAQSD